MNYYIIAGEASGDLQASLLIRELKITDKDAQFRCFGGDLMEAEGAEIIKHYKELAFMGVEDVLMNLKTIFRNIAFCKEDIKVYQPDVLILVDYPGFNMKIAKWAKANNIKVFYYISPKIWAWNQKRVHQIKKVVDKMFVILPFEEDFYKKFDYNVDFVGHPLIDCITEYPKISLKDFRDKYQLSDKPIIALLPGSRKQEITAMLNIMLSVTNNFPDYQFVIAGAPSQPLSFYKQFETNNINIIENKTYDLLQHATAALVVSGTATLETALFHVPQVVCYKTGKLFYHLAKMVVKIKFISLVNLVADKEVVKELIQDELTTENLTTELSKILVEPGKSNMLNAYKEIEVKLGGKGASKRAAELIVGYLKG
ncbi:MAG: lipid-A-disaccharide synthase [Flavobacteriales bacterium BRH_c54]|nr:MAG: lipid-A-disaccharide synthase [Flavobacteriales bacterium BRH_c54]